MAHSAMYNPQRRATVDVEVKIVQGSEINDLHTITGMALKSSYFVELELDNVKQKSSGGHKAKKDLYDWDESFIFTANRESSRLTLKLYCKHGTMRSNHVIGEATRDFWDIPRHQNVQIDLHDPVKSRVSGKIMICLKVAATVTFSTGPALGLDLQSSYSLNQMTKIVESLSSEESNKLSPGWLRFIKCLDTVALNAYKISELHAPVQVALGAVSFALKAVLDGIARDERIESMVDIMGVLHAYIADTYSIDKIVLYKDTLRKVLIQTTECSYFIGDYRRVTQFSKSQRVVVNLVSNADAMIQQFEDTFRDLKIELILGSSLQTAVVSFRVLQKVENIETMLYIEKLKPLKQVGWAPSRACLRGTRNAIINDLVQWASNSAESGQIYVLQGPPDCGKSSIAHSVAEAFHLQNRLGAAIFLDDRTEGKIIGSQILSTTIASQLASYDQNIGAAMAARIKADASIAEADIERQFPDLIVSATKGLTLIGPICIIIDGLANFVNPAEEFRFLTAIADYFRNLPSNFRILLTVRQGPTCEDIAQLLPHCIFKEITFDDEGTVDYNKHVLECLRHLFSKKLKLAEKYTIDDLHVQFVERSRGVYFWVSMAYQFLLLCPDGDECTIMNNILTAKTPPTKEVAMDQLFRIILTYSPYIPLVCRSFIRSSKSLSLRDPSLRVLVTVSESTYFLSMMQDLGFLIENRGNWTDSLFSIHPCLEDFLTSSRRCYGTPFYVDRLVPTQSLTRSMVEFCFDSMAKWLRQNICSLDDTIALNEEIPDRDRRVGQCIPIMLQYACRNWMFLLEVLDGGNQDNVKSALERLDTFLSKYLLHWIKCMSLLGWVDVVRTSLDRLSSWLTKYGIPLDDDRRVMTMDAIRFIHAFGPIISKAAMQTYRSALPLMPSDSLLSKKYSTMSRPSLELSGSRFSQIIPNGRVILSINSSVCNSTIFGDVIALSLSKGGIAFFDTRTGNEIGSRIFAANCCRLIAFSPNGQWIVTQSQSEDQCALDIWNVETRSHVKTIAEKHGYRQIERITYSTDGSKVLIVAGCHPNLSPSRLVFVWDVKTDTLVKLLGVARTADEVAISPDGSQIAVADELGIKIIDVSTGRPISRQITPFNDERWTYDSTPRLIWSPNGQFIAFASLKISLSFRRTEIYLLSLSDGAHLSLLGVFITKYILDLAFSPDSSKVVAINRSWYHKTTLSIWCTRSASLVGTTSFEMITATATAIDFAADGRDILIRGYYSDIQQIILLRFNVVPTYLETYMHHPPKFYPSQTPHTIRYSRYISGAIDDYAFHVDADGWILNTRGEREIWTPWANYEVLSSCKPPQEGQTQYRTLKVRDPEAKTVVLIYVITFEQEDVNRIQ